jgi:hypothetical protein
MFTHGATDVQLLYQLGKVGGALTLHTMDDFIDHTVPFPSSCAACIVVLLLASLMFSKSDISCQYLIEDVCTGGATGAAVRRVAGSAPVGEGQRG